MKIAIVSGKGGSGKSSISAAFAALSDRVVAVDCDVDASNLPLLFPYEVEEEEPFVSGSRLELDRETCTGCGLCAAHCAFGALRMEEGRLEVRPLLCEACGLCTRLCPAGALRLEDEAGSSICTSRFPHGILVHGTLRPGDDNSGKMIARMRTVADRCMEAGGIGLQILDGPPGIGCPVLSTVTGMDRIVVVAEPTLSGLADLRRIHEVCASFCSRISVIINKCDINAENCAEIRRTCSGLDLPVVAELPFDRRMVEAQTEGRTIVAHAPDSVPARELERAWRLICR